MPRTGKGIRQRNESFLLTQSLTEYPSRFGLIQVFCTRSNSKVLMESLIIIIFILLASYAYGGFLGAPWFATWSRDIDRFLKLAQIKPGDNFYDLGCGDGKLVIAAAKAGAKAKGFEISILPYFLGKFKTLAVKNAQITYGNFWGKNLADADIVYLFLTPKANLKVREKLEKELKKGTRVIAYTWPIEGWPIVAKDEKENSPTIYLYKIN